MIRYINAAHSTQSPAASTSRMTRQPAPATAKTSFDQQLSGALKQHATSTPLAPAKSNAAVPASTASQRIGASPTDSRQSSVTTAACPPPIGGRVASTTAASASPQAATGVPTGFSRTDPSGAPPPTGMGDLLWDTKNNQWVSAAAAKDRGWWNEQSAGWQAINQMTQGFERTQAAIAYAAAHPNEPMLGQVGGYGYGPTQVNQLAAQYGYTWMPGIGGDPIQLAPGLTMPNSTLKEYDPTHPPPGSIMVNMNLVNG